MKRKKILDSLRSWSPHLLAQKRIAVAEQLFKLLLELQSQDPTRLSVVASFSALQTEPDPELALQRFGLKIGTRLLPQITDASKGEMRFVIAQSQTERVLGVLQPSANAKAVSVRNVTLVLVPGVAFSRANGGRVGRGKGFYDRILADAPQALKVGLCFSAQLLDDVELHDHDQRMDLIVTEEGISRWP